MEFNGNYTDENGVEYTVKCQSIKECFTNCFAQTVYKLEDGSSIYVSYDQDRIEIRTPVGTGQ